MPAPSAPLLAAIRAGTAVRSILFELDHSSGYLRAWDGVGDFVFEGNTFLGVRGFGSIEGVSNSADVQNHKITVALAGIPYSAIIGLDPKIKGRAARIVGVWSDVRTGEVLGSLTLVRGKADYLISKLDDEAVTLKAVIKAAMADWGEAPAAYWSDADQQRRFPGDVGLNQVKNLQNVTVSGWGIGEELTAARVISTIAPATSTITVPNPYFNEITGAAVGSNLYGPGLTRGLSDQIAYVKHTSGSSSNQRLEEETTRAWASIGSFADAPVTVGGPCFLDVTGVVKTPGALRVLGQPDIVGTSYLREAASIAETGAATSETVDFVNFGASYAGFYRSTLPASALNHTGLIFPNKMSYYGFGSYFISGVHVPGLLIGTIANRRWKDAVTGAFLTISGSNKLQVNGANCVVSTTGVVLSSAGNRIIRETSDADTFLRVWT